MPLNEGSSTTDLLSYLRSCSKILKRVPRASCEHAVRKLAAVLENVVSSNHYSSWTRLFYFPSRCLRVTGMKRKVGSRLCLEFLVVQQIQEKCDPLPSSSDPVRPRLSRQSDFDVRGASLAARVSTKLDAGKFRDTVRLACSEDSIQGCKLVAISPILAIEIFIW